MEDRIRELKRNLQYAIEAETLEAFAGLSPKSLSKSPQHCLPLYTGKTQFLDSKVIWEEIDALAVLRRMNSIFEVMTRGSYFNLTQSYPPLVILRFFGGSRPPEQGNEVLLMWTTLWETLTSSTRAERSSRSRIISS